MKRRVFIKHTLATSALGIVLGTGLLKPNQAFAAWPQDAFSAKGLDDALAELLGSNQLIDNNNDITIKAPDIAENGAVVPITVSTTLTNISNISVFVAKNPQPLVASFNLSNGVEGFVSTRIKMRETSAVIAVIQSGGKLYKTSKTIKVTIGGCGG